MRVSFPFQKLSLKISDTVDMYLLTLPEHCPFHTCMSFPDETEVPKVSSVIFITKYIFHFSVFAFTYLDLPRFKLYLRSAEALRHAIPSQVV